MAYAAHHKDFAPYLGGSTNAKRDTRLEKSGLLWRIVDAMFESRQRQSEREVESYIARSGGRLTDDLERRMMRRLTTSNWSMRE